MGCLWDFIENHVESGTVVDDNGYKLEDVD
jgi:hypothetical protein